MLCALPEPIPLDQAARPGRAQARLFLLRPHGDKSRPVGARLTGESPLTARKLLPLVLIALLTGCASHEGTYTPACTAYAGDEIELADGRFVWDKFTDQVVIDDAGEKVDQFPEHPVRGRYRIEGSKLILESDGAGPLPGMVLHRQGNDRYLMTDEQFEAFSQTGELDDCALILGGVTPP
jgi:hypothetical protein